MPAVIRTLPNTVLEEFKPPRRPPDILKVVPACVCKVHNDNRVEMLVTPQSEEAAGCWEKAKSAELWASGAAEVTPAGRATHQGSVQGLEYGPRSRDWFLIFTEHSPKCSCYYCHLSIPRSLWAKANIRKLPVPTYLSHLFSESMFSALKLVLCCPFAWVLGILALWRMGKRKVLHTSSLVNKISHLKMRKLRKE